MDRPTRSPWLAALLLAALCLALAPNARGDEPTPARLHVAPDSITLRGEGDRQQVAVSFRSDAEGPALERTGSARFLVEPEGVAAVSPDGLVTPIADGRANLRVEADGLSVEVPIEVRSASESRPVSYRLDVVPLLSKAGCNMGACHGNLNGKGGLRLSLRGEDPESDLLALTRDTLGRRLSIARPDASLLLQKPAGAVPHEGGLRLPPGSPEYRALRDWIAQGARDDHESAPAVVRVRVEPAERLVAAPGLQQQLVVTAELADGSRRDVTRQAAYDLNDPTRAEVTPDGRVVAVGPGEVAVAVRYGPARATSRLAFLPDRPDFAWNGPEPANVFDEHVFKKLRSLKINPAPPATDSAFVRRAYLDALGVLPTPEEARAFLLDDDPDKRSKLVDRLLERPEFADFWALKWADLLRNEEKTMGPKGVWTFQRWLRDQVAADVPMDQFARALVTSTGSTFANPPASFHRTNRDPQAAAEAVGQVFLGVRLQCARCHNHPFDTWTQDDYYGLAAYFAGLDRKAPNNVRRDQFDKHEINADEIVFPTRRPRLKQPRSGEMMAPRGLGGPVLDPRSEADALEHLADWLTVENRQFARALANRVWFHLMGRGVVEPVDDFRESNPPSNPELLDALADELIDSGMRLRPLVARIMKSRTYGLSAIPDPTGLDDEANFARATVRLLPAEILLDALGQALDAPERFRAGPRGARAAQLAGPRMGGEFLRAFGKPDRLLTCGCERSESTTLAQAFQLINGESIRAKLEADDNRLGRLLKSGADEQAILDDLYHAALARAPNATEQAAALAHIQRAPNPRQGWEDVAWALVNSKEFLLRH